MRPRCAGPRPWQATRTDLRKIAHRLGGALPPEFTGLAALLRWVEGAATGRASRRNIRPIFYTLRPAPCRPRPCEHAAVRTVAAGRAAALHLPQGAVLPGYATWSDRKRPMWPISWRANMPSTSRGAGGAVRPRTGHGRGAARPVHRPCPVGRHDRPCRPLGRREETPPMIFALVRLAFVWFVVLTLIYFLVSIYSRSSGRRSWRSSGRPRA
jgi:hypothetical protein